MNMIRQKIIDLNELIELYAEDIPSARSTKVLVDDRGHTLPSYITFIEELNITWSNNMIYDLKLDVELKYFTNDENDLGYYDFLIKLINNKYIKITDLSLMTDEAGYTYNISFTLI